MNKEKPLGRARQAVIRLASLVPISKEERNERRFLLARKSYMKRYPGWATIARGILPSLRYVINCEKDNKSDENEGETLPDTYPGQGAENGGINPYGSWYSCVFCNCELAELYYSCDGCELLLDKEFTVCAVCYSNNDHLQHNKIVGLDDKLKLNDINWTPNRHHVPSIDSIDKDMRDCEKEDCQSGKSRCLQCSMILHTKMTQHRRFNEGKTLDSILQNCEDCAKDNKVMYSQETERRLNGDITEKCKLVKVRDPYYTN